jgi:hypothetical protein
VLLYELLTGTTPFDKARLKEVGYDELRRIIRKRSRPGRARASARWVRRRQPYPGTDPDDRQRQQPQRPQLDPVHRHPPNPLCAPRFSVPCLEIYGRYW